MNLTAKCLKDLADCPRHSAARLPVSHAGFAKSSVTNKGPTVVSANRVVFPANTTTKRRKPSRE